VAKSLDNFKGTHYLPMDHMISKSPECGARLPFFTKFNKGGAMLAYCSFSLLVKYNE
jgi:hypothetical protein